MLSYKQNDQLIIKQKIYLLKLSNLRKLENKQTSMKLGRLKQVK